jgi:hypothetical protein
MNLNDLDTMIMDADPALDVSIPSGASASAQQSFVQLTSLPHKVSGIRRPLIVATGVVGAAAAALIVLIVTVVAVPSGQQADAATVLLQAAKKAGEQHNRLNASQYLFSDTRTLYEVVLYAPSGSGTLVEGATAQFIETNEVWINARDNGRVLRTQGALRFSSAKDQSEWDSSPVGQHVYQLLPNSIRYQGQTRPEQSLVNLSDLPTVPNRLESVLANDKLQTNIDGIPRGPDAVFERAAALLLGPDFGMSPALASALFHVMANQRGARLVGGVTAHSGRRGVGVVQEASASGNVSEVVLDPSSGTLLQTSFVSPPTTMISRGRKACSTSKNGSPSCRQQTTSATLAPIWTDLVSSGIVPSDITTVPSAQGRSSDSNGT